MNTHNNFFRLGQVVFVFYYTTHHPDITHIFLNYDILTLVPFCYLALRIRISNYSTFGQVVLILHYTGHLHIFHIDLCMYY